MTFRPYERFNGYTAILNSAHYQALLAKMVELIETDYDLAFKEINNPKKNINTILRNVYNWQIRSV